MRSPALPAVAVILGLAFLLGVRPASAQAPEWVARYNGGLTVADATPAVRRGLALDAAGNAVVTGRALLPDPEFRTIKYSPSGARLWSVGFGGSGARSGEATGVVLDAAGNAYVTGVVKAFDGQSNDFLTVKYAASDGHVVWERSCDGDLHDADGATAIAADAQGDVYVTGTSWGLSGTSILTVKYRGVDGAELWRVVHTGQGGAYPAAILADAVGGVVVAGQSGHHIQVIRYDAATGARVWGAGPAPGTAGSSAHALALDAAGNAYVTGYSYAGPNPERRTLKLSVGDGSVAWSVASADAAGRAVAVDQSGGVYVAGGATTKYAASDGSLVWNVADPGPYGGGVTAFALALDPGGGVLVTGKIDKRRRLMMEMNKDNVVFERGTARVKGGPTRATGEAMRAGDYALFTFGTMMWEAYVVQVEHEFTLYQGYTTTLTLERATNFVNRATMESGSQSPWLAEQASRIGG